MVDTNKGSNSTYIEELPFNLPITYLSDKYKDEEFKQVGNEISNARNVARAHYKSDSDMGKKLGESMYNYIKNGKR